MAVKVQVRTEAETKALERYQAELDAMRKKVTTSSKSVDEFTKEMRKLDSQQRSLNKLTGETTGKVGGMKDMFGGFVITAGDVVNGLKAIGSMAFDSITAYTDAQTSLVKLQNTLDNMPALANETTAAYEKQANAIERATGADADFILEAQSMLGTFRLTGEEIRGLTPLVVDYSQKFGVDMVKAAVAVGKAADGNRSALQKQGVSIDEAKFKADRYGAIMDALASQVGGFAEDQAVAGVNAAERLEVAFGALSEAFGRGLVGDKAGEDVAELTELLYDLEPAAEQAGDAVTYLATNTVDFLFQAAAAGKSALGQLSSVQQTVYDEWIDSGASLTTSLRKFEDAVNDGTIKIDGLYVATGSTTEAVDGLTESTGEAAGATSAMNEALEAEYELLDDVANVLSPVEQGHLDVYEANLKVKKAQENYNAAIKEFGRKSDEARVAEIKLEEAKRRQAEQSEQMETVLENENRKLWDQSRAANAAAGAFGELNSKKIVASSGGFGGRILMADGGIIAPTPGGVPVTAAEAGVPEAFIPLERTPRSLALLSEAARRIGGSTGSTTYSIVINAPSGSATAIASEVERVIKRTVRNASMMGA